MGLSIMKNCRTWVSAPTPNPDPMRFDLLVVKQIGNCVIVKIHYPDCINFGGNKICVFMGVTVDEIRSATEIDPHFAEDGFAPIARFMPTIDGYDMAVRFCEVVSDR